MPKFFKTMTLPLFIVFTSLSVLAGDIQIHMSSADFSEELIEKLFEKDVFSHFWAGDDGVECGEPYVDLDKIDHVKKIITLRGSLSGTSIECQEIDFTCEIEFVNDLQDTLIIQEQALSRSKNCYYD